MSKLQRQKRKRGLILTREGWQKIQNAKLEWEYQQEISGHKCNLDELCEHAGITPVTYRKVLTREVGVDKQTLVRLFMAFNLELEKSDYTNPDPDLVTSEGLKLPHRTHWGEANDVSAFYGRTNDLNILEQWIIKERCRVVAVLGMGGIGKTSLVVKIAQQIQSRFEYVIWRSLYNAPPLFEILANLIQFVSNEQVLETDLPNSAEGRISRLIDYLQQHRCLIVLDNAETILQSGICAGHYREGYEDYGLLIKRVGEISHTSCLLLTSREKPQELVSLEGQTLPVRSLSLNGLEILAGQKLFEVKGLLGTELELETIVNRYAGNALALKIVATTIQHVFDGNISEFLKQDTTVFGDIRELLEQQFLRLSNLEKDIMYWLAINREPVSLSELRDDIVSPIQPQRLLEALDSLVRRSLVEKSAALFTQQPVVMEFVTQRLVDQVCQEIATEKPDLFRCHALMKATAKDYIRETQIRLILQPVIDGLLTIFRSKKNIEHPLTQILARLQETSPLEQSYTAGNIFNLLCRLETDFSNYDFSYLNFWQADLRGVNLHDVNFSCANLDKCMFAETLGGIHSVAFSPDGKLLAVGDTYSDIHLYQVSDAKQMLTCKGHTGWIWPISFSADGCILASGSDDQTIKLWDTKTGQCLTTLQGHTSAIWSLAFSSQDNILISGSEDKTVRLWNILTGECFKTLSGHNNRVTSIAAHFQGTLFATASDDQTIKLWNIYTGQYIKTIQGHHSGIRSIAFSPDGCTLASGYYDATIRCWDISTSRCIQTLIGHNDEINSVAFSSDGRILASGSDDRMTKLWDFSTGHCLITLKGHGSRVWSVAFSPDNQTLASGSDDQTVRLWDVSSGQCLKTIHGYCDGIWGVAFCSNGNLVASGSNDQTVKIWDTTTGECLKILLGHTNRVTSVAFKSDSYLLASASEDQTVKVWDAKVGECRVTLHGHSNRVTSIAFNSHGTLLTSGSEDQTVKLWDTTTWQPLKTLQGHTHWVWSVSFSPDGHILASGCRDQTVRLWDTTTGQCLKILQGHTDWIWTVSFSPNGRVLATGSSDQTIRLWDISTGKHLGTLEGHSSAVYSVTFIDNNRLASGSNDCSVKIWDITTGTEIGTLIRHSKLVWSVTFNPQRKLLASGSQDNTISLLNIDASECLKTLRSKSCYQGMNIAGISGLTQATITTLKSLGAVEVKSGLPFL